MYEFYPEIEEKSCSIDEEKLQIIVREKGKCICGNCGDGEHKGGGIGLMDGKNVFQGGLGDLLRHLSENGGFPPPGFPPLGFEDEGEN